MKKHLKTSIICAIMAIIMTHIIFLKPKNFVFASSHNTSSEIVIERTSKRVLYESNSLLKRGMASTTKIVTAITVIENSNLSDEVEIKKDSVGVEGSSIYLEVGDRLTVEDLLYGLMLRSGNDAAVALANHVSGSVNDFAKLMNKTALSIGAINSSFTNPHGLTDSNHYTTAYDLALITAYALENPTFRKIVSTKKYTAKFKSGKTRVFINKNKMLLNYDCADGVKTGYTKDAGRCLVSSATKNGMQLICVVLNCGPMFERSEQLLDACFDKYSLVKVINSNYALGKIKVNSNILDDYYVDYGVKNDLCLPLSKNEKQSLNVDCFVDKSVNFPVKSGKVVGNVKVLAENKLIYSENLYIIKNKDNYSYFEGLGGVVKYWNFYEN